jgi:hypothetical protein
MFLFLPSNHNLDTVPKIIPKDSEKNLPGSWALVANTCNPSYSEGRDQEDGGLQPARANSLKDLILKNTQAKNGLTEWLKW